MIYHLLLFIWIVKIEAEIFITDQGGIMYKEDLILVEIMNLSNSKCYLGFKR